MPARNSPRGFRPLRLASLCGALLALATGCGPQKPPNAGQPTPQAESMARMLADVDRLRAYGRGDATQLEAEAASSELAAWSSRMAELFPPEEAAHLYVDMTPEMAREAPTAMSATIGPLSAAVRSGNRAKVAVALDLTEQQGCGACHRRSYR